ncbi:MAG TPA: PepSY-like domain-containing protein [Candidatus Acidoferrales bacterium]|jgi:hypothetical protein|nr:PepSY-like domain-containing protein [Candidatus Acidoferrales bacterium]
MIGAILLLLLALGTAAWSQGTTETKKAAPKAGEKEEGETQVAKKDVPAPVLAAFAKAYPNALVKGYAKESEKGQTMYEVESMEGKTHRDVSYSPEGKLLIVEESMDMKDVPAAVQQALEKKFPKAKINLVEKVTEGGSVGYEFKLTTAAGKKVEVKFDADGKQEKP